MVWSLKRSDGQTRILRTRGKPVLDDAGNFKGYRGVGSDITESVEALDALKESEERFRDFAASAADWFFELDARLTITYYSCSFHIPTGKSASDLIGMNEVDLCKKWSSDSQSIKNYLVSLQRHEVIDAEVELF